MVIQDKKDSLVWLERKDYLHQTEALVIEEMMVIMVSLVDQELKDLKENQVSWHQFWLLKEFLNESC